MEPTHLGERHQSASEALPPRLGEDAHVGHVGDRRAADALDHQVCRCDRRHVRARPLELPQVEVLVVAAVRVRRERDEHGGLLLHGLDEGLRLQVLVVRALQHLGVEDLRAQQRNVGEHLRRGLPQQDAARRYWLRHGHETALTKTGGMAMASKATLVTASGLAFRHLGLGQC